MLKYFVIIVCFIVFACNEPSENRVAVNAGPFLPQNNSAVLDHHCQNVILQYEELLKGFNKSDTNYLRLTCNKFIHYNDSLAALNLVSDSTIQKIWVNGILSINAELEGVLAANAANDVNELKMAMHMSGLQLLNLLGQIGYKEHTVYVFNIYDANYVDGYTWIGLQKITKDPFHVNNHDRITATQTLQELK